MIIVGHNLVTDLTQLVRAGYQLPVVKYFCTQTAAQWLYSDQTDFSLEHLALRMTNMPHWRKTLGKLKIEDFEKMDDAELQERCGRDAEAALRLYPLLDKEIGSNGIRKIWDLAMNVLPILAEMGGRGMAVDLKELKKRARDVGRWLTKEKAALESTLGIANLDSHQQLATALYGPFGAIPLHKTTQGYSTDRKSLMWARYQARQEKQQDLETLLTRVLEYGTQRKLHSTYYKGWLEDLGSDQHIHSFYSLGRTATGRLASASHNLQNVPDIARELIIPSQGFDLIVAADMSQIEWRCAAHTSQDPVMLDWVRRGMDAHSMMAARVLGLPEPQTQTQFDQFKAEHPDERAVGKMSNFAVIFGVGAESLTWQIFKDTDGKRYLPPLEVQRYIDAFFHTFVGYKQYISDLWYALHRKEWITCPTGFRWQLPPTPEGWRKAMDYPVQRLASDLTLIGLLALAMELKRRRMKSRLIGEVHDSVVLEVPRRELSDVAQLTKHIFEHPNTKPFRFTLSVPLAVEITAGETWADLKELRC